MLHLISTQFNAMFMHENTCNILKCIYPTFWRHLVYLYISRQFETQVIVSTNVSHHWASAQKITLCGSLQGPDLSSLGTLDHLSVSPENVRIV